MHSFRTGNKLKSYGDFCKDHDYCHKKIPDKNFILNTVCYSLSVQKHKILICKNPVTCHNNPEESYTSKIYKHTACGYSLFI